MQKIVCQVKLSLLENVPFKAQAAAITKLKTTEKVSPIFVSSHRALTSPHPPADGTPIAINNENRMPTM